MTQIKINIDHTHSRIHASTHRSRLHCEIQTPREGPVLNQSKHARSPEKTRQDRKHVQHEAVVVSFVNLRTVKVGFFLVCVFVYIRQPCGDDLVDGSVDSEDAENHDEYCEKPRVVVGGDVITIT